MIIEDLNRKNIIILGFAREGQAALAMLKRYAPEATVTVADKNSLPSDYAGPQQTGENYLEGLDRFDVVIKSPGIKPNPALDAVADKITNTSQIFLDSARARGAEVIGVTGSKGKSTTSSLIYAALKAGGKKTFLVGNIGDATLNSLPEAGPDVIFVQEMSSYQLMNMTSSPHIAVITALFPDHLDYHGGVDAYYEAKSHIVRFQTVEDMVFAWDGPENHKMAELSAGTRTFCGPQDLPPDIKLSIPGEHNRGNAALAFAVASQVGIKRSVIAKGLSEFTGLPHRLQNLGEHYGITWINDANAATPEASVAALDAFGDQVGSIILGGLDRGYDFSGLAQRLAQSPVREIILFPGTGPRIQKALEETGESFVFHPAEDMEMAVAAAKQFTPQGKICLLSTASPSYNMFKKFEEKGEMFKKYILE